MSIKRSKQRTFGRERELEDGPNPFGKKTEPEKTWEEHTQGKTDDAFAPYAMTSRYAKGDFIAHSKFGKGVVVDVEGTRITILFQDGPKKLGHAATA